MDWLIPSTNGVFCSLEEEITMGEVVSLTIDFDYAARAANNRDEWDHLTEEYIDAILTRDWKLAEQLEKDLAHWEVDIIFDRYE